VDVVFDCADPDRVARFWMVALPGYDFPHGPPDGYRTWEEWADANNIPEDDRNRARTLVDRMGNRPTIFFNRVPEGKTAKNRVHLDIRASAGMEGEDGRQRARQRAQRLVDAGVRVLHEKDEPIGWSFRQDLYVRPGATPHWSASKRAIAARARPGRGALPVCRSPLALSNPSSR
jgi:hypothetical protein